MRDVFYRQCASILDAAHLDQSHDPPVIVPPSVQLLREVIRCASGAKQGLRIVGGGTMPTDADDHPAPVVSLAKLDAIPEVNVDDRLVVAQAGAPADTITTLAEEYGLSIPLGLTSGSRATVGGMFMTDAYVGALSGNGTMRSWVIGLSALNAAGEQVTFGGRTVKNVTGFDVTRMLAGTMGLYAVATQVILRALPLPELQRTIQITVPADMAGEVLGRIIEASEDRIDRCDIMAPEGFDGTVTIAVMLTGFNHLVKARTTALKEAMAGMPGVTCANEQSEAFVERHRELSNVMIGQGMYTLRVPPAALPVLFGWIRRHAPESPVVAHAAHGRVHVARLNDDIPARLREHSRSIGGTMPAAWGQGMIRSAASLFNESEMVLARALKRQLDPNGIFNPQLWI